jgi:hypothetical protein
MENPTRMNILETDRLILCRLTIEDAAFIFDLLNDSLFLRFIGDKGIKTRDDAVKYILNGPIDNYDSISVLEKLGLTYQKMVKLSGDDQDCKLFGVNFQQNPIR